MRPILTPAEASALDRESRERGVTVEFLMENAGRAVARAAAAVAGGLYGRRAVAVCGKGNNGGDGLVAARYLARWGLGVTAVLLEDPQSLREPSATNLRLLQEVGARIRPASSLTRELARADVAIDAVFGTGFRGVPEDIHAEAIEAMNESGVPVVAVDIPSGVNGETGEIAGEACWAVATVTFGAAKAGLVFHPGAERCGLIEVVDIGFPRDLVRSDLLLVERDDVAASWPRRRPEGHKRASGVVLVLGGSRGMTGAVRLMASAAYRTGAGLVTVAVPQSILPVVQEGLTEATFVPLPETADGTIAESALSSLKDRLEGFDAVAIGPGMTTNEETAAFARSLVRSVPAPVVVDADALNAFAGQTHELAERESEAVLTPHAGEFARLAGASPRDLAEDRIGMLRKLTAEVRAVVLMKGSPTLVAQPGGEVRVITSGGPVLSTGGTGDVLTGMITALVGRGLLPVDAATGGAFTHGVAGELVARELGEGAVAGDVGARIPEAVAAILEPAP
jgi:NAD(P)H-hydrate epimerase